MTHTQHPTPKEVAQRWVAAYNSHDPDAAAALYDNDVTNDQFPWGKTVTGRDAMRSTYSHIFRAFPDIRVEIENLTEAESRAVVEWRFSGTMKGEFAGFPPTNRSFNLRGCEVFEIVDGRIRLQRGYWDKATLFDQLGIATSP